MALTSTRAVVLQTYRYSETSKILRLMTRKHGPVAVIARGALRPRSRFGGLLEPFAEGEATLYLKRNRELHSLSAFELVRERQALGVDLVRFTGASVLCEMVLRLAPEQRDDRLYGTLIQGLDALLAAPESATSQVALGQIWRMVASLGFATDFQRCVSCHRPFSSDEGARFDGGAGGLTCGRCPVRGMPLAPDEVASLRALADPEAYRGRNPIGPQGRLLVEFIRHHLAEGAHLRSLEFLGGLP